MHNNKPARVATELNWRGKNFFIGGIYAGCIQHWSGVQNIPEPFWRAWIMIDDDGVEVGRYPTAEAARAGLEAAVKKELGYE